MKTNKGIRLLCLVLCLSVLLPCVSALGETAKVSAYLLRLRASASEKGKVLDAFPRGTKVKILKNGDEWTKVEVHGKEGYMKTSMLSIKKDSDDDSGSKDSKDSGKKKSSLSSGSTAYVQKGIRLNLREKASSSSDILGSFRGGTKVSVLKKGGYWSKVEVDGLTGYMANEYLTSEK
jgi:mannosyl-glycoprotein endo-beta-N-acetylglucosaminidase